VTLVRAIGFLGIACGLTLTVDLLARRTPFYKHRREVLEVKVTVACFIVGTIFLSQS